MRKDKYYLVEEKDKSISIVCKDNIFGRKIVKKFYAGCSYEAYQIMCEYLNETCCSCDELDLNNEKYLLMHPLKYEKHDIKTSNRYLTKAYRKGQLTREKIEDMYRVYRYFNCELRDLVYFLE